MLIAIEGPDLTGKTTLARELEEAWNAVVMHAGPPEHGALASYEDPLVWYDPLGADHLVLDRWHVGEYVWPAIFRRRTDYVDPAVRRHVEMFMCSRGCTVVYASRNYIALHEALGDSDEPLRPSHLARCLELFDEALNDGHNRGFVFDHDHELRHLTPQDLEFVAAQAWDDVAPLHGCTSQWIGHPDPRYVIAVDGHSDWTIPGRVGLDLDPTVAQLLRDLPERAWRGFALLEVSGLSDEAFDAFARTASPRGWITVGERAHKLVAGSHDPRRQLTIPYGYATFGDLSKTIKQWIRDDEW